MESCGPTAKVGFMTAEGEKEFRKRYGTYFNSMFIYRLLIYAYVSLSVHTFMIHSLFAVRVRCATTSKKAMFYFEAELKKQLRYKNLMRDIHINNLIN